MLASVYPRLQMGQFNQPTRAHEESNCLGCQGDG